MASRKGIALYLTIMVALIGALAGLTMLTVAISHIKRSQFWHQRGRARYLAEAGLVLARERLFIDPDYCGGTESLDTNGDQVGDTPVTIGISNCGEGNRHEIRATARH